MQCKKIYLGQDLSQEDWNYGIGSIYLAGPRNIKGKSWRLDFISKIENTGSPVAIFIPESKKQLEGCGVKMPQHEVFTWQHFAMSMASSIIFWFPNGSYDVQSYVEFGSWYKAERIFLGHEGGGNEYLDWLLHKEQMLYPAENMDQLVEMVIHWIKE